MTNIILKCLNIYPIKSLRGVSVERSAIEDRGLQFDRRWMLVDSNGEFLTQRTFAPMATVGIKLTEDGMTAFKEGMPDLSIPFVGTGGRMKVKVWSFEGKATTMSEEADDWFSAALGTACRLVTMPMTTHRKIHPHYGDGEIAFSDAMPVLVASQASLDLLNSKLEVPLPMNRFRANVILFGTEPHAEDEWERIRIGEVEMRRTKKCGRCLVTTTDQETGERGIEPLRTLAEYRKEGNTVFFGSYYVPVRLGTIAVGQAVEIM